MNIFTIVERFLKLTGDFILTETPKTMANNITNIYSDEKINEEDVILIDKIIEDNGFLATILEIDRLAQEVLTSHRIYINIQKPYHVKDRIVRCNPGLINMDMSSYAEGIKISSLLHFLDHCTMDWYMDACIMAAHSLRNLCR